MHNKAAAAESLTMKRLNIEIGTLGDAIKQLRQESGMSVRGLARDIGTSASFISDIELGRRYPSGLVLNNIAKSLNVRLEQLQQFDTRAVVSLVKKMVENNPAWGNAFRAIAEAGQSGRVTPEEVIERFKRKNTARVLTSRSGCMGYNNHHRGGMG